MIACGHTVGGGGGGGAERTLGAIGGDFAGCAGRVMEVSISGGGVGD